MKAYKDLAMIAVMAAVSLTGCEKSQTDDVHEGIVHTYEASEDDGIVYTYYELDDGTWMCKDTVYQYRLELTGRMPNAIKDSSYVVLTDQEELTFEDVIWSWLSSQSFNKHRLMMEGSKVVEWR